VVTLLAIDLNVLVISKLDEAKSTIEINKQLESIQKKLQAITLDVKFDDKILSSMNKFSESMSGFTDVAKTYDIELRNIVNAQQQTGNQTQKNVKTMNDLTKEYGELGNAIKNVTRLNGDLQKSSETNVFEPSKGTHLSVNTDKNDAITSVSITNTEKAMGTLVGTYSSLMNAELQEKDLSAAISQAYDGRIIREIKLNEVTGQWSALLSENATQNRKLTGVIDSTTGSLYRQTNQLVQAKNVNMGFMEQIKVAMARIPTWFISMTLYVRAIQQITGSIKYLNELDSKLNEIAIVTNRSQKDVANLAKEYHNLAYAMSTTTQGIAEASVTFYRQGLQTQDVMSRVKTSIEYAKISGLGFAEASEILTSSINSLGVPAERVSDVFAYLGDAAATGKLVPLPIAI
jgi:hypothetical protein